MGYDVSLSMNMDVSLAQSLSVCMKSHFHNQMGSTDSAVSFTEGKPLFT